MINKNPNPCSEQIRHYPVRPFLAVSVAILREDKVLLILRKEKVYSLPGGVVELGETLEMAALRELREEVDLSAELISPLPPVEVILKDEQGKVSRHMVVMPFAAHWVGGEAAITQEACKNIWVKPSDIADLPHTQHLEKTVLCAFRMRDVVNDKRLRE